MPDPVRYEFSDGIALITLDREAMGNSIDVAMGEALPGIWEQFRDDPRARVAIITGAGSKCFCTGADVTDPPRPDSLESIRWTSLQNKVWKPVICAVNGMAVGGGLHFVADSDIVIAAGHATFFDTHVKVGLAAGLEPVSLCRRMSMHAVLRMALLGGAERMSAQAALAAGLVSEVIEGEALRSRAFELAGMIGQHSPSALARTKRAIWESAEYGLHEGLRNAWALVAEQAAHPDFEEGARAFRERRAPRWS